MLIPKNEIDKAAESKGFLFESYEAFKAGIEFAESYVQKHIEDIIIENQGLKLYKDNELKRFKQIAVDFLDSIRGYERENGQKICFDERSSEELFEIFKTQ